MSCALNLTSPEARAIGHYLGFGSDHEAWSGWQRGEVAAYLEELRRVLSGS